MRLPKTANDGQWFRFAFHLGNRRATICNPWFKFLVVLFAQEPAAAITGAHICDACVRLVRDAVKQCVHPPRFARARRALWIFFAAVAVAATPRGAVETTLREKINISGSNQAF